MASSCKHLEESFNSAILASLSRRLGGRVTLNMGGARVVGPAGVLLSPQFNSRVHSPPLIGLLGAQRGQPLPCDWSTWRSVFPDVRTLEWV